MSNNNKRLKAAANNENEFFAPSKRVLSIQSHTVHGYVGNKAATFPMQLLGLDVDVINSVQLSNHKGYPKSATGQVLHGEELLELIKGLDANDLLKNYSYLLTGYMGSASFLRTVSAVIDKLRQHCKHFVYYCDPVLGDGGKLYVPQEMVEIYKSEILPKAQVLLPNQFEMELLSNVTIKSKQDAFAACDVIHGLGVETIIITSVEYSAQDDFLTLIASQAESAAGKKNTMRRYTVKIPKIKGKFSGTGDLIAALLLSWSSKTELKQALELSCRTMYAILLKTNQSFLNNQNEHHELLLIQSQNEIQNPPPGNETTTIKVETEENV